MSEKKAREIERESTYIFTRIHLKENLFANPQLLPPACKTMTFQQEKGPRGFQARRKIYFESHVFVLFVSIHLLEEL